MADKAGLTRLTGNVYGPDCDDDDCPNVYVTDHGTFVVQGNAYDGFKAPEGEGLVELPEHVLREAIRVLGW